MLTARRLRRSRRSGGTRMLAWASRPRRLPSRVTTLVSTHGPPLATESDLYLGLMLTCSLRVNVLLDHKCPFTSNVSIRGRILTGRVISTKMTRTIIVRRDYLHYIPKYRKWRCLPRGVVEHGLIVLRPRRPIREATQELGCPLLTSFPCGGRRYRHRW